MGGGYISVGSPPNSNSERSKMRGGYIRRGSGKKNCASKLTGRVLFTCVVAAFGGLIFGYGLGISGSSITFIIIIDFIFLMFELTYCMALI